MAPGPVQLRCQLGLVLGRGDGLAAAAGSGDTVTVPRVPSTSTIVPAATSSSPVDGDDTRDAELAGDDRGVAGRPAQRGGQRDDERRVQARGVGGREILGAQDRRNVGQRNARLRQAAEFGDDAVADVPQIGDAFGHQAAELGEHVDELVDRCDHRRGRPVRRP